MERDRERPDVQTQMLCKELWAREDRGAGTLSPGKGVREAESGRMRRMDRSADKGPLYSGAEKKPGLYRTFAGNAADGINSQEDIGDQRAARIDLILQAEEIRGRITETQV